jgi:hypothetical protein
VLPGGDGVAPGTVRKTPVQPEISPSRIADLVRRIRVAEAQGLPTEALRRELDEAMARLK